MREGAECRTLPRVGGGCLQVDKLIVEEFPDLNHKPALFRAFHAAAGRDQKVGRDLACVTPRR